MNRRDSLQFIRLAQQKPTVIDLKPEQDVIDGMGALALHKAEHAQDEPDPFYQALYLRSAEIELERQAQANKPAVY